jgi:hypothetical protein
LVDWNLKYNLKCRFLYGPGKTNLRYKYKVGILLYPAGSLSHLYLQKSSWILDNPLPPNMNNAGRKGSIKKQNKLIKATGLKGYFEICEIEIRTYRNSPQPSLQKFKRR